MQPMSHWPVAGDREGPLDPIRGGPPRPQHLLFPCLSASTPSPALGDKDTQRGGICLPQEAEAPGNRLGRDRVRLEALEESCGCPLHLPVTQPAGQMSGGLDEAPPTCQSPLFEAGVDQRQPQLQKRGRRAQRADRAGPGHIAPGPERGEGAAWMGGIAVFPRDLDTPGSPHPTVQPQMRRYDGEGGGVWRGGSVRTAPTSHPDHSPCGCRSRV